MLVSFHGWSAAAATFREPGKGVNDMTVAKNQQGIQVRAGSRTYFVDVGTTAEGKRYLKITASRYKGADAQRERASIIVFPEHAEAFVKAVTEQATKLHM